MKTCNLVLKGGVSSGLVYARAVTRLKDVYRFRGLAGASAGAIAAAFAAAADYARAHGDAGGFGRLERHAGDMVRRLKDLFEASAPFRPLLRATIHLAPGSGRANYLAALTCFAPAALGGAGVLTAATAAVYAAMHLTAWEWAVPALVLAAILGAVAGIVIQFTTLVVLAARDYNFGISTGLALTAWLHAAVQDIAGTDKVLTFADLAARDIDLRMVASQISLARPVFLPELEHPMWFEPAAWRRLFPDAVMAALAGTNDPAAALWRLPDDMPVIVALRMSLACPGLFEQVPVYAEPLTAPDPARRLYIGDGGLTVNFPFDLFLGNGEPTLAIDLESLAPGETRRVWRIDEEYDWPVRFTRLPGPLAFCWSLFRNMREGQNRAASRRPRDGLHVFRIGLRPSEGGMNLDMTADQAAALMAHGAAAGDYILKTMGET